MFSQKKILKNRFFEKFIDDYKTHFDLIDYYLKSHNLFTPDILCQEGMIIVKDLFEIFVAVFAVFGFWKFLHGVVDMILYPPRIRRLIYLAVYIDNCGRNMPEIAAYVKSLRREGKVSGERLIILSKSDIIDSKDVSDLGTEGSEGGNLPQ